MKREKRQFISKASTCLAGSAVMSLHLYLSIYPSSSSLSVFVFFASMFLPHFISSPPFHLIHLIRLILFWSPPPAIDACFAGG